MNGVLGQGRVFQVPHFDPVPERVTDPSQLPVPPRLQLTPPAMVTRDAQLHELARYALDPAAAARVMSHWTEEPTQPARHPPPHAQEHGEEESPVELDASIDPTTGEPEIEGSVSARAGRVRPQGAIAVQPGTGEVAVRGGVNVPVRGAQVGVDGGVAIGREGVAGTAGARVTLPLGRGVEGSIGGGVTVAPPREGEEHPEVTPSVGVTIRTR